MMLRWRHFAKMAIVTSLIAAAFTASAASFALLMPSVLFEPGSAAHILTMAFGVIMGLFGFAAAFNRMFVMPIIERQHEANRAWLKEAITELGKGFDNLIHREVALHIESEEPHPKASAHLHEPLKRADEELLRELKVIGKRLSKLTHAHNEAMKLERSVAACMAVPQRAPHRATDDPGSDFTKKPEIPSLEALIIPTDDEEEPEMP